MLALKNTGRHCNLSAGDGVFIQIWVEAALETWAHPEQGWEKQNSADMTVGNKPFEAANQGGFTT